jgi:hypothetical protein
MPACLHGFERVHVYARGGGHCDDQYPGHGRSDSVAEFPYSAPVDQKDALFE